MPTVRQLATVYNVGVGVGGAWGIRQVSASDAFDMLLVCDAAVSSSRHEKPRVIAPARAHRGLSVTRSTMSRPPAKINSSRIPVLSSVVLLCDREDWRDEVLVQRLPRAESTPTQLHPGKRYAVEDGKVRKLPFNAAGWFRGTRYLVSSIDDVHAACEAARLGTDGGPGYLVSGAISERADPRSMTRRKNYKPGKRVANGSVLERAKPKGVVDAARHWLVLDLDDVPAEGLDPRRDPEAALARLRSLLPPSLASARTSWQWSASCCLAGEGDRALGSECPKTVGAHLRVWCDQALDEAVRKSVLARLAGFVRARCPGAVVDVATAIYNQAVFTSVSLENGLPDPFPGITRSGILDGSPEFRLADLLAELPELGAKPPRQRTDAERAARAEAGKAAAAAGRERRARDTLLRSAARSNVIRPSFVRRDPLVTAYGQGRAARIAARTQIFRERALEDVVALVDARRVSDPAWADGAPDGMRIKTMRSVAALLSWLVPANRLDAEIEHYCLRLVTPEWFRSRWLADGLGRDIVASAYYAAMGAASGSDVSRTRDDRCKTAIMNLLRPTLEEQVTCGLRALRTEAVRSASRRDDAGVPTLEERRARPTVNTERPWLAEGISRATWYRRRREAAADTVTPVAAPEPEQDGLTADGVEFVADIIDPYSRDTAETRRRIANLTRKLGIPEVAEAFSLFDGVLSDALERKACSLVGRPNRTAVSDFAGAFAALQHARNSGVDLTDIVQWVLDSDVLDVRARSARSTGPVVLTVEALQAMAEDRCRRFGSSASTRLASELRDMAAAAVWVARPKRALRPVGACRPMAALACHAELATAWQQVKAELCAFSTSLMAR